MNDADVPACRSGDKERTFASFTSLKGIEMRTLVAAACLLIGGACSRDPSLVTRAQADDDQPLTLSSNVSVERTGAAPADADWPAFRGADGSGVSGGQPPASWSANENIRWKAALPGAGASAPIILGGRVYVTCSTGYGEREPGGGELSRLQRHLIVLDRATGEPLLQRDIPARLPEQEEIRENYGYAGSTPVTDGSAVYCFFGKSGVHAFSLDGEPLWQADVGDNVHGWGSAASPVLHDNLLIVNASVESESLIALDKRTGDEQWRARGIRESWNTPTLVAGADGRTVLLVAIQGALLGFDPDSGAQLWSCRTDIPWYMVPSVVSDGETAYCIGGRTGGGFAVRLGGERDVTDSHRRWWIDKGSNVPSPVLYDGHLYWAHENNSIVYCADAATGEIVYEERLPRAGQVYASPLLADGKLYYLTRDGRMFVLAARPKFEQIAMNELGDRSVFNATPAIAGDELFVRSDHFLYCIAE